MANEHPFYYRLTVKLLLVWLLFTLLVTARDILIPITVAVFLTFLLLPISEKLESWRIPRPIAIIISILVALTFFGGLIYFFYNQILLFSDDFPALKKQVNEKTEKVYTWVREQFHISKREQRNWMTEKLRETAKEGDQIVFGIFSATTAFIASVVLIPIYIFFLSYYRDKFKDFIKLVAKEQHERAITVIKKVSTVSKKYLKGIFLDVLILSVLNSVGFLLLDIKHAILFGVLAALLNVIPYVGVLIGSILPIAMALITKDDISYAAGVLGVCIFVQFLDNNFITPLVVGSSVSINPLTAVIVLIASALVWGLPGMILSLPMAGVMKVVCDNVDSLKPYGFLIGEEVNYRERKNLSHRIMTRFGSKPQKPKEGK